jgi:hypothetical protein
MINNYNILGTILFSQSLIEIRQKLEFFKKDRFEPLDRIVIEQDIIDEYLYSDGFGTKLIEIQKIINPERSNLCRNYWKHWKEDYTGTYRLFYKSGG